jgi:multiple sugar transport system substrate-binding protein
MSDKAQKPKVSRRQFLRGLALAGGGAALAACAPKTVVVKEEVEVPVTQIVKEVVKETVVVEGEEVEVTKVVEKVVEKVVTATPPPKEPVPIVATSQMTIGTWDNSVERAKERLPNINMSVTQTGMPGGWSGYADQIITQIAGGEQLDVIMIAVEGIPLLGSKNILLPLEPFIDVDAEAQTIIDDTHELLLGMLQWEGKQLELPFSWNNMVMYYNTQIFEEKGVDPPAEDWTWDDFLETCLAIADVKGTEDDLYAYSFWGSGMFGMCAWYFVNDTSPLTDDWQDSNMLDPKVAETLQFLADLILEYKVTPNPTGWDEWGQFHGGHLAMRTCGRWCISGSLNEGFETYDLQYQPYNSGPFRTVAGTDGWGIATMSRYPDEAWEVVKLLSGKEASLDMVALGGNIPTLRSVAEMPEFKEYGPPNTAVFYESLDYAKTVVSPPNFNIIEPILDRNYATIWNGEKTVEEAVQAAHEELQAEMDKLKEA